MLDLKFIREHPEEVKEGIRKKGDTDRVDEILKLDVQRRELLQKVEIFKNRRNVASEEIGKLKRSGGDASQAMTEMESVKTQIKSIDDELHGIEDLLNGLLLTVANIPHPSVPEGKTPADNQVISEWGDKPAFSFKPKPHWEIVEKLGIIDFE
jgi:seryl-tRNA synthetase